jgi:hypothetical protein
MKWTCGFCKSSFKGRNATKALAHVAKLRKMHISPCTATIPEDRAVRFQELVDNAVGGSLLDLNFKRKEEENLAKLRDGADVFGLCFLGDGATVKRMPLFNVLGANANTPPVVL